MPLIGLLALAISVSEPRIPAGGPGGNMHDATITIASAPATQQIDASLDAPAPTPLLSTGFPFTEGTRLWTIESDAPRMVVHYLFPMRGTYELAADATQRNGTHVRIARAIAVPEDPRVLRTLALFALVLLSVGTIAGYLLAAGVTLRTFVPYATTIVLLALVGVQASAMSMTSAGTVGPKTGTLWTVAAAVPGPADFEVVARNVEDGKPLIRTTLPSRDGRLRMRLQFYDGAQHEVRVRAVRGGVILRTWTHTIVAQSQPPPLGRRLWVLAMMLAVVAVGYAAGGTLRVRRAHIA